MNAGVITNILRTGLIMLGTFLVSKYGADQAQVDEAVNAGVAIGGAIIAGAGAIWSLLRSIKRAQAEGK